MASLFLREKRLEFFKLSCEKQRLLLVLGAEQLAIGCMLGVHARKGLLVGLVQAGHCRFVLLRDARFLSLVRLTLAQLGSFVLFVECINACAQLGQLHAVLSRQSLDGSSLFDLGRLGLGRALLEMCGSEL